MEQLSEQLRDKQRMKQLRENVWNKRMMFCFDEQAKDLVSFFRKIINQQQAVQNPKEALLS
jgi:hypothetical protein